MPYANDIIGLRDVEVESVSGCNPVIIEARFVGRTACAHCEARRYRIKASFARELKHTRQGTRLLVIRLVSHKYLCLVCHRYFNLRIPGVLPRRRATENFRLEVYEKHHGGVSQRLISKTHAIGEATVERWYRDLTGYRVKELQGRPSPRVLGIDEHFFTRKLGYATTLCDLGNHKIHDVILGRSEEALKGPLQRIRGRHRTRIVVMDLSETYRSIARKHFPQAMIVADRFHVIRLVNYSFLKTWQQIDPSGRKNRGLLSLMRRHEQNLDPDQKLRLQQYLSHHPALQMVYEFKQRLCLLLLTRQRHKAALRPVIYQLVEMIDELKQIAFEPLRVLGLTLERWQEEIGRMLRFSKSNGITEGFHNKMEMISRRAFGFRNFPNYRLRVLAHWALRH
jgi:transposase